MNTTSNHDERMAKMKFASVYPMYLAKVERKEELNPDVHLITGMICGYRVENIEKPLTPKSKISDKLKESAADSFNFKF